MSKILTAGGCINILPPEPKQDTLSTGGYVVLAIHRLKKELSTSVFLLGVYTTAYKAMMSLDSYRESLKKNHTWRDFSYYRGHITQITVADAVAVTPWYKEGTHIQQKFNGTWQLYFSTDGNLIAETKGKDISSVKTKFSFAAYRHDMDSLNKRYGLAEEIWIEFRFTPIKNRTETTTLPYPRAIYFNKTCAEVWCSHTHSTEERYKPVLSNLVYYKYVEQYDELLENFRGWYKSEKPYEKILVNSEDWKELKQCPVENCCCSWEVKEILTYVEKSRLLAKKEKDEPWSTVKMGTKIVTIFTNGNHFALRTTSNYKKLLNKAVKQRILDHITSSSSPIIQISGTCLAISPAILSVRCNSSFFLIQKVTAQLDTKKRSNLSEDSTDQSVNSKFHSQFLAQQGLSKKRKNSLTDEDQKAQESISDQLVSDQLGNDTFNEQLEVSAQLVNERLDLSKKRSNSLTDEDHTNKKQRLEEELVHVGSEYPFDPIKNPEGWMLFGCKAGKNSCYS